MIKTKDLKIFSFIWAFIFILIGLLNSIYFFYAVSSIFIIIGVVKPILFTRFYKVWIGIGEFIGGIVSKLILFILYFGLFTPVSIFLKILGN